MFVITSHTIASLGGPCQKYPLRRGGTLGVYREMHGVKRLMKQKASRTGGSLSSRGRGGRNATPGCFGTLHASADQAVNWQGIRNFGWTLPMILSWSKRGGCLTVISGGREGVRMCNRGSIRILCWKPGYGSCKLELRVVWRLYYHSDLVFSIPCCVSWSSLCIKGYRISTPPNLLSYTFKMFFYTNCKLASRC